MLKSFTTDPALCSWICLNIQFSPPKVFWELREEKRSSFFKENSYFPLYSFVGIGCPPFPSLFSCPLLSTLTPGFYNNRVFLLWSQLQRSALPTVINHQERKNSKTYPFHCVTPQGRKTAGQREPASVYISWRDEWAQNFLQAEFRMGLYQGEMNRQGGWSLPHRCKSRV